MKYVVVLCDGMSDRPLDELKGKTPLEVADKPNMDYVASHGNNGMLKTLYTDLPADSGVANLTVMGYDPHKYYPGRGPLEAMNMDLHLSERDVALRCNTVSERNGVLVDYSAGYITSSESKVLMRLLDRKLGGDKIEFHSGVAYRNLLILRSDYSPCVECQPAHDIVGKKISENMVKPMKPEAKETAELLNRLILDSKKILEGHAVNENRAKEGRNTCNMIWPWGPGRKPKMPSFRSMFGLEGAIISAVDIIKGIGRVAGLDVIDVKGATGYLDTNYEGKADAALKSLEKRDFVYVHLESTDEAGHEGSVEHKIRAIEDIDKRVLGRILDGLDGEYTVGVLPDHATPVSTRTHTDEPVPFAVYSTGKPKRDSVVKYSERDAKKGHYGLREGVEFMRLMTGGAA
jgi:2,3-bisphosphoglycerate-independent phosphoglycerate mutase